VNTFTWIPDFGSPKSIKPNVSTIKFGDGYEQRQAKGINSTPQSWKLTFSNRDATESAAINSFLTGLGGVSAFFWTPPGESNPLVFKCALDDYTYTPQSAAYTTITATFDQVFES
jgi:phage-related protein